MTSLTRKTQLLEVIGDSYLEYYFGFSD